MSDQYNETTIVTISDTNHIFFGVNQDGVDRNSKVRIIPPINSRFGRIFFGQEDSFPEGGINDQGLCYHSARTPESMLFYSSEKDFYNGNPLYELLGTCSRVSQVIEALNQYNIPGMEELQIMVADASGEAVVISVGEDSELCHTYKETDSLVLTNFNLSNPQSGNHPCLRYEIAEDMLKNQPGELSTVMRNILSATHQEGLPATQYSLIYNLNPGIIYLFLYHDYGNGVKFKLSEAIKNETVERDYPIKSLFRQKLNYFADIKLQQQNSRYQDSNPQNIDIDSMKLSTVAGIGEVYSRQMASIGIESVADFLEICKSRHGRENVAEKTGISTKLLTEWVNHADLLRLNSISIDEIKILENTGIDTVSELSQRNPEELYENLLDEHGEEIQNRISLTCIEGWIEQARTLLRIVEY